jgi:hypothetical protein
MAAAVYDQRALFVQRRSLSVWRVLQSNVEAKL